MSAKKLMVAGGTTAQSGYGPSPSIWASCPWLAIEEDPNVGYRFWDDFLNTPVLSTTATTGQYACYADTGNTIVPIATEVGGVLRLSTDATDNDSPIITTGGNAGVMGKIVSGSGKKLWFEARIRVSSAALSEQAIFVGLTEEGLAADNGLHADNPDTTIGGAMADKDYIGFGNFQASAPKFAAIYNKAGGTDQIVVANAQTYALDTWYKLGFVFAPDTDRIYYYVDGVLVGSFDVGDAGTTNFPSGEELALTIGFKNGAATAKSLDIDWWRFCQLR